MGFKEYYDHLKPFASPNKLRLLACSAHILYYLKLDTTADDLKGFNSKGLKFYENECKGIAGGFIKRGVFDAVQRGLASFKDDAARQQYWRASFSATPAHFLKGLFRRCTKLGFDKLASTEEWRAPLEDWVTLASETVYLNRGLLGGDGMPKEAKLWAEKVVYPTREAWPRWELGIGDVPMKFAKGS